MMKKYKKCSFEPDGVCKGVELCLDRINFFLEKINVAGGYEKVRQELKNLHIKVGKLTFNQKNDERERLSEEQRKLYKELIVIDGERLPYELLEGVVQLRTCCCDDLKNGCKQEIPVGREDYDYYYKVTGMAKKIV